MNINQTFAILAPIPEVHLNDGQDVCQQQGKVAFGSQDWELFREVDKKRGNDAVEVFIYTSSGKSGSYTGIYWHGLYIGHVNSRRGRYPNGNQYCPPSAQDDTKWAIFWEVEELDTLVSSVRIEDLQGLGKKTFYSSNFFPKQPVLIEYPKIRL
jgi:hypothetical protein